MMARGGNIVTKVVEAVKNRCLPLKRPHQHDKAVVEKQTEQQKQGIFLDQTAVSHIKKAMGEMRKLQSTKIQHPVDLEALEHAIEEIHDQKSEPTYELGKIKRGVATAPKDVVEKLEATVAALSGKLLQVETMRMKLETEVERADTLLRKKRAGLAQVLEELFVAEGVLDDDPQAEPEISAPVAEVFDFLEQHEIGAEWTDLKQQIVPKPRAPSVSSSVRQKNKIKETYHMAKAVFIQADRDFEARSDIFDKQRADWNRARNAGASVISSTAFGFEELRETQNLTRGLAKAEEALREAKQAALAAGVDVEDSDMASGFVDNVGDGYRMSLELDMQQSVKPERIGKWLEGIPEVLLDEPMSVDAVDIDFWNARSVDLYDSYSVLEWGEARRRIDEWKLATERLECDDEVKST